MLYSRKFKGEHVSLKIIQQQQQQNTKEHKYTDFVIVQSRKYIFQFLFLNGKEYESNLDS